MAVTIDGVDLATLGFRVRRRAGDLAPALDAPPMRPAGDGWGERVSGAPAAVAARTLTLVGRLEAASAYALEAARDALVRLCAGGATGPETAAVTIVLGADGGTSTRQLTGYLTSTGEMQRRDPTGWSPVADVTLVFRIPDPRWAAATLSTLTLSTTIARPTTLGDVQVRPVIDLDGGAWTSTVVTYKDGADVTVGSCTITKPSGTAGAGHTVRIDCDAQSVVRIDGSGVVTPQNDWLTAGDFLTIDPADVVATVYPGIVLSTGTGDASWRDRWR